MLSFFRKLAGTWVARIFFGALAAAFVGWGVANRGALSSAALGSNDVATVDGQSVTPQSFAVVYKNDLATAAKRLGDSPSTLPAELKSRVAQETLSRLIVQAAMSGHASKLGITTPDSAVANAISAMPAFQGIGGKFDRSQYVTVLSQSNMAPVTFQEEMRTELTRNQILDALEAGVAPSDKLINSIYTFAAELRRADMVSLPISGRALPPAPEERILSRYYDNNISRYTAPEYRHVKLVVLSPASIGRSQSVSEAEMHTWLNAHKAEFEAPEMRDIDVIAANSAADAASLATRWKANASWDAMQKAATAVKASAVELKQTDKFGVPSPELADAAFAATDGAIVGPIKVGDSYQLALVSHITPAKTADFTALRDQIRKRLGEEKALELVDPRAQKLQDLFAGGSRIDEIPADLGADGAEGTLDAEGNTLEGSPAPIPAPENVRKAILADIFKATKNDAPQLTEGPDHVWYAIALLDVIKPAPKPFATVRAQVLADWQHDQIRHTQEAAAAKILSLVNGGQSLANAVWGTGLTVTRTPPIERRGATPAGLTPIVVQTLFTLKQGQATMAETADGFVVASLAEVVVPPYKADSAGVKQLRDGLTKSLQDDLVTLYATTLRDTAKLSVNSKLVDAMTATPGE